MDKSTQRVFDEVSRSIRNMGNEQAVEFLEDVISHLEAMVEGIKEDIDKQE